MGRPSSYPKELRERAVRLVAELSPQYDTEFAAIRAVAQKLGIGSAETLRQWVRRAQVDAGVRPGVTTDESVELKRLRRENAELRRANEILKARRVSSRPSSTGPRGPREVHRHLQGPPGRRWPALGGRADLRRAV